MDAARAALSERTASPMLSDPAANSDTAGIVLRRVAGSVFDTVAGAGIVFAKSRVSADRRRECTISVERLGDLTQSITGGI